MLLDDTLEMIKELDTDLMKKAQHRLDSLTKPLGSLGKLEDIAKQIVGITGRMFPKVDKKAIVIMCSDNGVVEEGVAQAPKSVTASVTRNFMKGITGVNILAKHAGSGITVVDIGVEEDIECEGILNRKIRKGTWNIAKGPAMTGEEAIKAVETGIEVVRDLANKGVNLLGTGEMGIGNTTTSSAIAAVLTGCDPGCVVGKGAGLTTGGLNHKINIVKRAIEINKPEKNNPMDVLAKLGGFDIAGLAGCFIGAAAYRIPVLIDGFISSVAALVAVNISPGVRDFIIPSHGSAEPGSKRILDALGLIPMLNLEMRLGEGTGAALGFHIIDAAIQAYICMGSFEDAEIEQYRPL